MVTWVPKFESTDPTWRNFGPWIFRSDENVDNMRQSVRRFRRLSNVLEFKLPSVQNSVGAKTKAN